MTNSRWKSIQGWEQLEKFMRLNPTYFIVDTRDKERRYMIRSKTDKIGISVDGRSVNAIMYKLEGCWKEGKRLRAES